MKIFRVLGGVNYISNIYIVTSMCCLMRSSATLFSAPRGIITSAYFLVGILWGNSF